MAKLTLEEKKEIMELYADRSNKAHDIAKAYGLDPRGLADIVIEMGGQTRRPRTKQGARKKNKKCPKCHRVIELSGARFCPYCGNDIRTETEILIERATWLWQIVGIVGENDRDKARDIINELINHLKKEGQK